MDRPLKRSLCLVLALAAALLCAEGGLSLAGVPTLGARLRGPAPGPPAALLTVAGRPAAAPVAGLYADHADPLVRYVLRPDSTLHILDGRVTTNALGLRARPGPPAPEDALRIVVLGDSVAFGYGVDDGQTLAARLEHHLQDVRGEAARSVACHTVAVPSWNHRAAVAALFDHWDAYRPEIVVYVPVHNDLSDANSVLATGQMRLAPDPTAPDPWLVVSRSRLAALEAAYSKRLRAQGRTAAEIEEAFGPCAIEADLSAESSRRYDENAASIRTLADRLRERGARLLVVQSAPNAYTWHLLERLAAAEPPVPVLFLEELVPVEHTLVVNNHPNARTLDVRALWIASELLGRGWVDAGGGGALPEAPAAYAGLRMARPAPGEIRRLADAARERSGAALHHEVDLRTGRGLRQVFGGLNPDASASTTLLALLRAAGPAVELRLAALPGRPDLYPITIDVELAGAPAGALTLGAGEVLHRSLDLPTAVASRGGPVEVRLRPSAWCVVRDEGRAQVASFLPIRIACPPRDG